MPEISRFFGITTTMKPRTLGLVIEWAVQHKAELMHNWTLARKNIPPEKIDPME